MKNYDTCTTKDFLHLKKDVENFLPSLESNLEDRYVGTWHRTFENGTSLPNSARVIWLQTHKFFADIRIPEGSRELQMAFSGHTVIKDDRCEWHQWCGLSSPVSDTARLEFSSDTLKIKEFCDDGATEVWEKEDTKVKRIMSLQLIDEQDIEMLTVKYDHSNTKKGFFLVVGNDFMRTLEDTQEGDYESCFGKILESNKWLVSDSTKETIEGDVLYETAVMSRFGDIILERVDSNTVRRWLIHEINGDIPIIINCTK